PPSLSARTDTLAPAPAAESRAAASPDSSARHSRAPSAARHTPPRLLHPTGRLLLFSIAHRSQSETPPGSCPNPSVRKSVSACLPEYAATPAPAAPSESGSAAQTTPAPPGAPIRGSRERHRKQAKQEIACRYSSPIFVSSSPVPVRVLNKPLTTRFVHLYARGARIRDAGFTRPAEESWVLFVHAGHCSSTPRSARKIKPSPPTSASATSSAATGSFAEKTASATSLTTPFSSAPSPRSRPIPGKITRRPA